MGSNLTACATRSPSLRGSGVDERLRLNLPGFDAGAHVRLFVEDTTFHEWGPLPPEPRIRLRIADCTNEISLWFYVHSEAARENCLYKVDTLLGALERFRAALEAEAELYAYRAEHSRQLPSPGRRAPVLVTRGG